MAGAPDGPRPASPATLGVVRLGILLGVLAFGGVVWHLQRQPDWAPAGGLDRDLLFYAALGIWTVAAAGVTLVRARWRREPDPGRRTTLLIVGWALGELPAIWGAVYYLLTGDPQRYFTGLMFLVVSFLLLPVRTPERRP